MGGGGNFGGGVNQQILQQLGIDGPVTNQVFVANVSGQKFSQFRLILIVLLFLFYYLKVILYNFSARLQSHREKVARCI